jgi:hypothetical protein
VAAAMAGNPCVLVVFVTERKSASAQGFVNRIGSSSFPG